jgi:hypothetical protein
MYEGPIPHDPFTGTPQEYEHRVSNPGYGNGSSAPVMVGNHEFKAELKFTGFQRGRSAAHARYEKVDDPGWTATMFLTDLKSVIEDGFAPLYLSGTFCFTKRGTNYGIKFLV